MRFFAFAASHRGQSLNHKLVTAAADEARSLGAEVEVVRYRELDMPLYNDELAANPPAAIYSLAESMRQADGLLLAMPEFNWSFPGTLKNIIDWTSVIRPAPLAGKTVLLMSATTGARGGIVGMQQIKPPLEALEMYIYNRVFPLPAADQAFMDDGGLKDAKTASQLAAIVKGYLEFTKKLSV